MCRARLTVATVPPGVLITFTLGFSQAVMGAPDTVVPDADVDTYVSHGPMLGGLDHDRVTVWARTSKPAAFHVRFGTHRERLTLQSRSVSTHLQTDNTGWVELRDLQADTLYHYQVVADGAEANSSDIFQFRTLQSARHTTGPLNPEGLFNFAFSALSCAKQSPVLSQGPAPYRTLVGQAADRVHFNVVLGDWIYEADRRLGPAAWLLESGGRNAAMPDLLDIVPSLAGAWQNYKTYLEGDPDLRHWHSTVPSIFLFDDHEILNNFQNATLHGHTARNALFRDPALRAWRDYLGWGNPETDPGKIHFGRAQLRAGSPLLHDPNADFNTLELKEGQTLHVHWGGLDAGHRNTDAKNRNAISAALDTIGPLDTNAAVYEIARIVDANTLELSPAPKHTSESSYSIGGLNYFFSQVIGNAELIALDTRTHRRSPLVSDEPTMLGEPQKKWLLQRLEESEADILFVLSSVSFVVPHASRSERGVDDQSWTGYVKERADILAALEASHKTVILLTGDLHNAFSIQISDRLWEFSVGPIGSLNRAIGRLDESGVPANGPYASAGLDTTIRWSTHFIEDTPPRRRRTPVYTLVRVNNVFDSPDAEGRSRWIAFEKPQVVVQFYNANNGQLLYAESVLLDSRISRHRY